jgi:hypothetical protein
MPKVCDRKTKNGVTGEWDGQTWRQVEAASASGPKVGDRKTKNGTTGEWDGHTWREVASEPSDNGTSGAGVVAGAAAKAVPGVVSLINKGAGMAGTIARSRLTPAVIAGSVVNDVSAGNLERAATTAAGSTVAAYAVPKVTSAIAEATAPQTAATRDALGRFTSIGRQAGPVARAAASISRLAGPIGLAVETILGEGAAGHRPPGETPERTAERQRAFEQAYQELLSRRQTDDSTRRKSVAELRQSLRDHQEGK